MKRHDFSDWRHTDTLSCGAGPCPRQYLARPPERLVVCGFRSWMAGYEFGDIECWESAWRLFSGVLGPESGRHALTELQFWVRTVRETTQRQIRCFPACCRHLCRDECMALAAISAIQHDDRGTALAACVHLTGAGESCALERLMTASDGFAGVLAASGQCLLAVPPDVVEDVAARSLDGRHTSH